MSWEEDPAYGDCVSRWGRSWNLSPAGHTKADILKLYPYLEPEDIDQALTYAAWRVEEIELPLASA